MYNYFRGKNAPHQIHIHIYIYFSHVPNFSLLHSKIPSEMSETGRATEMNEKRRGGEGKKERRKRERVEFSTNRGEKSILSSGRRNLISVRTPFN